MIRTLARGLGRLSATLNTIALWGAVLAVLVMVYAASWQVIARYALSAPPIWTEELARRAMVWAGMLGASAAYYAGADPTLFPHATEIRGRRGAVLSLIRAAGVLMFSVPVIWFSLYGPNINLARGFLGRSISRTADMIPLPMIFFTAAVPLAFALIVLHLAARLAMRFSGTEPKESAP